MKRLFVSLFILLFVSVTSADEKPLLANYILKNLDPSTNTSSQIKEYGQSIKGKQMEGTGIVIDVASHKVSHKVSVSKKRKFVKGEEVDRLEGIDNKYKLFIYVGNAENIDKKDYNVICSTIENASNIKIGQKIKFVGEIVKGWGNSPSRHNYPFVQLGNVSFNLLN